MSPADEASAALDALIARSADKVRMVGHAHRLDPGEVDEVFQEVRSGCGMRIESVVSSRRARRRRMKSRAADSAVR